jgi:hypothetical protein
MILEIPRIFELAWEHAYPGREAAERNAAWRELWKALPRAQESQRRTCAWCRATAAAPRGMPVTISFT